MLFRNAPGRGEFVGLRIAVGVAIAFVCSAVFAFNELRYALWGKTVEGRVRDAQAVEVREGRGRTSDQTLVTYTYKDGDEIRNARFQVLGDWEPPEDGTVLVQYIPDDPDASRLAGHANRGPLVLFFVCLLALVAFVAKLVYDFYESERRPGRRPARP
jgi:hypothetical protein